VLERYFSNQTIKGRQPHSGYIDF
jgi:alpha-beta hydrolase superfamily lysophospholipase